MKKLILLCATVLFYLCLPVSFLFAQDTLPEFRKFGMGVSFQPLGIGNILEEFEGVPLTKINFAINATKSFRVELDFGMFAYKDKQDDYKTNAFNMGIGLLGTKRITSNVIMGGLKIDYTIGKLKGDDDFGEEFEDTFNRLAIGPVLEYEHLFGGRLGVGAELGLKFSSYSYSYDGGDDDYDDESTSVYTDSAFFVRIYF